MNCKKWVSLVPIAKHRFSGCPVGNVTEGPTQLDLDDSPVVTLVGVQPTRISEAFDLTIADSDQSESPAVQTSRRRRRAVKEEDSSEDEGPGPILLRRGRFAALSEDDTESVDNHSHAPRDPNKTEKTFTYLVAGARRGGACCVRTHPN